MHRHRRRLLHAFVLAAAALAIAPPLAAADRIDTIASVKRSVVAVGKFERTRSPPFAFRGTGFAVGDGTTIVTNAHVLPGGVDLAHQEVLAIMTPGATPDRVTVREVRRAAFDPGSDLALLKLTGDALPPLALRDSASVREGQDVLITGFPIGAVLGPFPVTHRGMVSAVTPIAIPQGNAAQLDPAVVHRLSSGSFAVFQLDATAYPGNSGSPVYDPATGEVIGIVNMVFVKRTKESALTDPSGITYAVPANHLRALLQSAAGAAPKPP
jgi:S1-C subfamily serine protease